MSATGTLVGAVGLLLCAALLATVLRTQRPEWAVGLSLLAGALVAVALLKQLAPLVTTLRRMLAVGGLSENALGVVLRAAGVCFVTQLAADTCRDAGESALASRAELTGRVLLLLMTVPLFEQVLTLIVGVAGGQAVMG